MSAELPWSEAPRLAQPRTANRSNGCHKLCNNVFPCSAWPEAGDLRRDVDCVSKTSGAAACAHMQSLCQCR
eukprot:2248363-Rhodomonas_salina.4